MIKNFKCLNFFLPHTWLLYTLYAGITFYSRFELIPYCFDAFSFHIYTLIHLFVLALSVIAPTPISFGKKKNCGQRYLWGGTALERSHGSN